MPTGRSLHIGVNNPDDSIFPVVPALLGPENDARAMADLATTRGFTPEVLTGAQATYDTVMAKLQSAAQDLFSGDMFLFSFAGHGSAEFDPDGDESDNQDEAILLFDRMLFDDELRLNIWPQFKEGVRVLMVADCCHAGTILARRVPSTISEEQATMAYGIVAPISSVKTNYVQRRKISRAARQTHVAKFRRLYQEICLPVLPPLSKASILLLAACEDMQTAADGLNGAFTSAMLKALRDDDPLDYTDLIQKIGVELAPQIPVLTPGDPPDNVFIAQKPFTI